MVTPREQRSDSTLSQSSISSTGSDTKLKFNGSQRRSNGFSKSSNYSRLETPIIDKKSIFVGQLEPEVTTTLLKNRFSKHGKIVDINLIDKPTSVFAFIKFETEQAAASALNKEDHTILLNRTMHVQYKEISGGHTKKSFRKVSYHNNGINNNHNQNANQSFAAPEAKAAPPPVGKYRYENNENGMMAPPFIGFSINGTMSDYGMLPFIPFNKGSSPPNGQPNFSQWSSIRSNSNILTDSESVEREDNRFSDLKKDSYSSDTRSQGEADHSENSESAGRTINSNSTVTTDSHSYFDKQSYYGNSSGNYTYIPRRKFSSRRSSYGYVDHSRNFFPPSYIYPFQYHMGTIPRPGSPGGQTYMIYPMLPPPPSGVENSLLPPPMGIPQPNGTIPPMNPITPTTYLSTDSPKFIPEKKSFALDY